jgi:hypothetical protein
MGGSRETEGTHFTQVKEQIPMSQATYRGVNYDTETKKEEMANNWLSIIRKQIEKEERLKQAQLAMAMK